MVFKLYFHKDILSSISEVLVEDFYKDNYNGKFNEIQEYDFLGQIKDISDGDNLVFIGFPPQMAKYLNHVGKVDFWYAYAVSDCKDNVTVSGVDSKVTNYNTLNLIEKKTNKIAYVADSGIPISKLYQDIQTGNIQYSKYKDAYDTLLLLFSNGVDKQRTALTEDTTGYEVYPKAGDITGTSITNFDILETRYNNTYLYIIPQEANYLAYHLKAVSRGCTAIIQFKFGMKSKGLAKFNVFDSGSVDDVVNFLKDTGFTNIKKTGNTGYGLINFNWQDIIQAGQENK